MKLYAEGEWMPSGLYKKDPLTGLRHRIADYRVLRAYGSWSVGSIIENPVESAVTLQMVRAKVWELMEQPKEPELPYLRGGPDDPEVAHLWAAKEAKPQGKRKKTAPAQEPDDGPAGL